MAAHDYRLYTAAATSPRVIVNELPLVALKYSRALNAPGTFQAVVPVDNRLSAYGLRAATAPTKTCLWVERDGAIVWGGFIWTRRYSAGQVQIGGSDFLSYLPRRLVATRAWNVVDQFQIVRDAISDMQASANGNVGLAVTTSNATKNRVLNVRRADGLFVFDLLKALADAADGFDFSLDYSYSGGQPLATLRLDYPYRGRRIALSKIVYDFPGSCLDYVDPEDGSQQANTITALGGPPSHIDGFATMSAAIAAGATITSIAVQPMSYAAATGFRFPYGSVIMKLSAPVNVGDTSLTVVSITTVEAFPSGQIIGTFAGPPLMAQMSATINSGVTTNSIAVNALTMAFPKGYLFPYGDQILQLTAAVAVGALALPVASFTTDRQFVSGIWIGQTPYGVQNFARMSGPFNAHLSAAVTKGITRTTLPVDAMAITAAAGFQFPFGSNTCTLSGAVAIGDTVLNVNSFTPNESWPAGQVIGTFAVTVGTTYSSIGVEPMTVTAEQGDTFPFGSLTLTLSAPVQLGDTALNVIQFVAIEAWPAGQIIGRPPRPLFALYHYNQATTDGYPQLDRLDSFTDIYDQATLNAKARLSGEHFANPLRLVEGTVKSDLPNAPVDITSLQVGDEVQFDIDDQWQTASVVERVTIIETSVAANGDETAHLTTGVPVPAIIPSVAPYSGPTTFNLLVSLNMKYWFNFDETAGVPGAIFQSSAPDGTKHPATSFSAPTGITVGVPGATVDGKPGVAYSTAATAPNNGPQDGWHHNKFVGLWVKNPGIVTVFVSCLSAGSGWQMGFQNDGSFYMQNGQESLVSAPSSSIDGNWHFVCITSEIGPPQTVRFYLDGVQISSLTSAFTSASFNGLGFNTSVNAAGGAASPASTGGLQYFLVKDGLDTDAYAVTPAQILQLWQSMVGHV